MPDRHAVLPLDLPAWSGNVRIAAASSRLIFALRAAPCLE
jgi:hypothetical protein